METQLTVKQKNNITLAQRYLMAAAAILDVIDCELQLVGTTGPNPINHTSSGLENTASYIGHWKEMGVDL